MIKREKSKRASKQLGDFGEQLVMHILVQYNYKSVALVDHVGADLIMSNDDKVYAISVKSRIIPKSESKNYSFDKKHLDKLIEFSKKFNMIPTIALVINDPEDTISVYLMTLNILEKIAKSDSKIANINSNGDISINYNANSCEIKNTNGIFITEFKRTSMNKLNL